MSRAHAILMTVSPADLKIWRIVSAETANRYRLATTVDLLHSETAPGGSVALSFARQLARAAGMSASALQDLYYSATDTDRDVPDVDIPAIAADLHRMHGVA